MTPVLKHPSSYRDPAGYLFYHQQQLYRQVSLSYKDDFDLLMGSDLYQILVADQKLLPFEVLEENLSGDPAHYKTLKPALLPFISYPYEWCFDMLKDAALLTLDVAEAAMSRGMMLKDASAYNIQWHKGRLIFIDSLSLERWRQDEPWIAYRQFCEHFLAPLALMHFHQLPMQQMLLAYPEGIPVKLAASLLPWKSKFHLHTYLHLHVHGKMAKPGNDSTGARAAFSAKKLKDLLQSLRLAVLHFRLSNAGVWSNYYSEAEQRGSYLSQKQQIIESWFLKYQFKTVIDAGSNNGHFSKLVARHANLCISADFDHFSVNALYSQSKVDPESNILPLIIDLVQPSPAIGVNNEERHSFLQRSGADVVMALGLIHHLAIEKHIGFEKTAALFSVMGRYLIIEFVDAKDDKARKMIERKDSQFEWYRQDLFEEAFKEHYQVVAQHSFTGYARCIYLFERLANGKQD